MKHAMKERESAYGAILQAVRENLAASAAHGAVKGEHVSSALRQSSTARAICPDSALSRDDQAACISRFQKELTDVGGSCMIALSKQDAVEAIEEIIGELQARRIAFSDSPLVQNLMQHLSINMERFEATIATHDELLACEVGITSAQWGIAETGTLVLEGEQERHRLVSLLPPVHIALIEASRICQTLGETLAKLHDKGVSDISHTVTFVTGPSRTSDIEMTLAIGVHGPLALHVIILQ